MQRLGKNKDRYVGETIDLPSVLHDVEVSAAKHGWTREDFLETPNLFSLTRPVTDKTVAPFNLYLSTGMHGDEPAGPLAVAQLLQENPWPAHVSLTVCPCLNPTGFPRNTRENAAGLDLNRDYRNAQSAEIRAHIRWLKRQPKFDLTLCLHEDWESNGFYMYELNPDHHPSLAAKMIERVAHVCPVDLSSDIEGWPAEKGVIRPEIKPEDRPQWPEALYLIQNHTRRGYTLEAPSDFSLTTRVASLVAAVQVVLESI